VEKGGYWIALFNQGGERAGIQRELARYHLFEMAASRYKQMVAAYPGRLVVLCDRATILDRSDRRRCSDGTDSVAGAI
jgi:hypothetical protein